MANSIALDTMSVRLKMVTPVSVFKKKLLRAMLRETKKKLGSKAFHNSIYRGTKRILGDSLRAQPEYQSMVAHDGVLRGELGVVDSESAMNSLVKDWVDSTQVTISQPRIVGGKITGTVMTLTAIQMDCKDVIDKAYASYTTEKNDIIPWLEWLLTQGQRILVQTHDSRRGAKYQSGSRTYNTIMLETSGAGWGVPAWAAGTITDNLATRAVFDAMPEIENLFVDEVSRRL